MAERFDEWPRVHTCLHNWCSQEKPECARCDAVCRVFLDVNRGKRLYPDQPSPEGTET
jgi:hypothetical protein